MTTKLEQVLKGYPTFDADTIKRDIEEILTAKKKQNARVDVYKTIFSLIDLTSLNTTDTEEDIASFTQKVNDFSDAYPEYPTVAAICVYPNMARVVKEVLTENVEIAAVAAGFPHSQTFMEVKMAETALAVMDGATEIDIVQSVGKLLEGKYDEIIEEIQEIKAACKDAALKVILESGALKLEDLRLASILAMEAGADFIKTSTGKQQPAATLEAAWVMCQCIKAYHAMTGRKVGFKAAGGIVTSDDAVAYYCLVEAILGEEWLNKELFRIGASRLANNLLSDIEGKPTVFF
ncbi:MAG: deoxyribose-phosphate aldolase [Bacteroidales bacterium]|nr:deoxyribose-phosphate aldolase [Bacteroidales bacterium]